MFVPTCANNAALSRSPTAALSIETGEAPSDHMIGGKHWGGHWPFIIASDKANSTLCPKCQVTVCVIITQSWYFLPLYVSMHGEQIPSVEFCRGHVILRYTCLVNLVFLGVINFPLFWVTFPKDKRAALCWEFTSPESWACWYILIKRFYAWTNKQMLIYA